jgi:DNA-binding MarR family transcriptional regulator
MPEPRHRSQAPGSPRPEQNTVALLGEAYSALGHKIVAGVVEAGFPQRPAHSGVFAHIDIEGGTRLTELARRANITPQAMGELVDDLEHMGYVTRRPDPEDRRAKFIVLSPRGVACVQAAFETIVGIEGRLERLLGEEQLLALREALNRIIAAEGGGRRGERDSNP